VAVGFSTILCTVAIKEVARPREISGRAAPN
jgi:hypothetical protein